MNVILTVRAHGLSEMIQNLIDEMGHGGQSKLVRDSGVDRTTINKLANGKTDAVKLETLIAIADAAQWTLEDIEIPVEIVQQLMPNEINSLHWICKLMSGVDGATKGLSIVLEKEQP